LATCIACHAGPVCAARNRVYILPYSPSRNIRPFAAIIVASASVLPLKEAVCARAAIVIVAVSAGLTIGMTQVANIGYCNRADFMVVRKGVGGVGGLADWKPEIEVCRTGSLYTLKIAMAINLISSVWEGRLTFLIVDNQSRAIHTRFTLKLSWAEALGASVITKLAKIGKLSIVIRWV
jgi:hypothetical protein